MVAIFHARMHINSKHVQVMFVYNNKQYFRFPFAFVTFLKLYVCSNLYGYNIIVCLFILYIQTRHHAYADLLVIYSSMVSVSAL